MSWEMQAFFLHASNEVKVRARPQFLHACIGVRTQVGLSSVLRVRHVCVASVLRELPSFACRERQGSREWWSSVVHLRKKGLVL